MQEENLTTSTAIPTSPPVELCRNANWLRESSTAVTNGEEFSALQQLAKNSIRRSSIVSPFLAYRSNRSQISLLLLTDPHASECLQQQNVFKYFRQVFSRSHKKTLAVHGNTYFVYIEASCAWLSQRFTGTSALDNFVLNLIGLNTEGVVRTIDHQSLLFPTLRSIQFSHEVSPCYLWLEGQVLTALSSIIKLLYRTVHASKNEANTKPPAKIKQHLDKQFVAPDSPAPIQLTEITRTLGMSISTAQREFKSAFGMTIVEYVRYQRLEKAKRLLQGGMSIGEVAYIAGYKHTANFSIAFKKYFGSSPGSAKP